MVLAAGRGVGLSVLPFIFLKIFFKKISFQIWKVKKKVRLLPTEKQEGVLGSPAQAGGKRERKEGSLLIKFAAGGGIQGKRSVKYFILFSCR